jgi:hypothetical protein
LSKGDGRRYNEVVLICADLPEPLGSLQGGFKPLNGAFDIARMEIDTSSREINQRRVLFIVSKGKLGDAPLK